MTPLSCLAEADKFLIADTSAVINLNATGLAAEILKALPCRVSVTDMVRTELEDGRALGRQDAFLLEKLHAGGLVQVSTLDEGAYRVFEGLVIGNAADSLDDGEASTIAYAQQVGGVAVIDEKKATRICAEKFSHLRTASTLDLLGHVSVHDALGSDGIAEALYAALRNARMRVPTQHLHWVIGAIGHGRAMLCSSLPREARGSD